MLAACKKSSFHHVCFLHISHVIVNCSYCVLSLDLCSSAEDNPFVTVNSIFPFLIIKFLVLGQSHSLSELPCIMLTAVHTFLT